MQLEVYGKYNCYKSSILKKFLKKRGIDYKEFYTEENNEIKHFFQEQNYYLSPIVKIDNEWIHGGLLFIERKIEDILEKEGNK